MGAAPEGVGGGPPPTPRACAPRGAASRVDAEAFRSHMETWMERVEAKVDGLTEVLGRRRVLLDGADSCVEGPSPILSLQRSFERQISSPFQKQQSAGTEISSPLQKQQSAGTEISSPFQTEQSAVADKEEAEPGGKRHGIVDSETEDGAISHRTTTSESPAAGDISMPTMEVGARSTSRESRERELTKRLELELRVSRQGPLGRFVQSQRFDSMVIALIVLNAAVLGVDVQLRAFSNTNLEWISYVELICTSAFTVELFLRVSVHRVNFFTDSRERIWNIYDFFLIAASWVDFFIQSIMSDSSAFLVKAGRVIRMFRIVRVVRTVRFLSQLRVMLQMIMGTLQSLFWVGLILFAMLYCVSIILTQGAIDYLNPPGGQVPSDHEAVSSMYGSLFQTMYTLFQCISGGVNWGQASYLMRGPGAAMECIVVAFVFFAIFAVVNIVNGVFVDGAIQLAKQDRMLFVEKQKREDRARESQLLHLLNAIDDNHDNIITFQEFCDCLERQDIIDYFSALHVDIEDAKQFFPLLDEDGCGQVDLIQFVTGMEKLRGEARSADIHIVLHQNRKVMTMLNKLMKLLGGQGDVTC